MKVNNIFKTFGEDLASLSLIKLDASLVYQNTLKTLTFIVALYTCNALKVASGEKEIHRFNKM